MTNAVCPIRAAINQVGPGPLSAGLGVCRSAVLMWEARGNVPPEHRPGIELLTGGRLRVERFGADVRWVRVPDAAWPHKAGRPLADFTRPARRPAARKRNAGASQ